MDWLAAWNGCPSGCAAHAQPAQESGHRKCNRNLHVSRRQVARRRSATAALRSAALACAVPCAPCLVPPGDLSPAHIAICGRAGVFGLESGAVPRKQPARRSFLLDGPRPFHHPPFAETVAPAEYVPVFGPYTTPVFTLLAPGSVGSSVAWPLIVPSV